MKLYLDIETTGDLAAWPPALPSAEEYVLNAARKHITGNNAKRKNKKHGAELEAEIAEAAVSKRAQYLDGYAKERLRPVELWGKSAVDPLRAQVTTVVGRLCNKSGNWIDIIGEGVTERDVLEQFTTELQEACGWTLPGELQVYTWRGAAFDIPMLRLRAVRYSAEPWSSALYWLTYQNRQHDLHIDVATSLGVRLDERLRWLTSEQLAAFLSIKATHPVLDSLASALSPWMPANPADTLSGRHLPVLTALGHAEIVTLKCIADVALLRELDLRLVQVRRPR